MADPSTLRITVDDRGVATVTMDRPEVRNAFNPTLIAELHEAAERLAADDAVRVVVLTGAGLVFSAGADLNWMREARGESFEQVVAGAERMGAMLAALDGLPKPLIGRVNGHALAGGTGLVAVCDLVIAVRAARFGFTEVAIGIAPAVISPYAVRKIGRSHARALFTSGEQCPAEHAQRIGLVHEVEDDLEALDAAVDRAVQRYLRAGPKAVAAAKRLVELAARPLDEATAAMPRIIAELRASEEGQEGMGAFLEKRPASWVPPLEP